jgi:hypothetical protein
MTNKFSWTKLKIITKIIWLFEIGVLNLFGIYSLGFGMGAIN